MKNYKLEVEIKTDIHQDELLNNIELKVPLINEGMTIGRFSIMEGSSYAVHEISDEALRRFAEAYWNKIADQDNQWSALGTDEKLELIREARTLLLHEKQAEEKPNVRA